MLAVLTLVCRLVRLYTLCYSMLSSDDFVFECCLIKLVGFEFFSEPRAVKNVSKIYFVSSGMKKINSVSELINLSNPYIMQEYSLLV